jgi:hypothetical protein
MFSTFKNNEKFWGVTTSDGETTKIKVVDLEKL